MKEAILAPAVGKDWELRAWKVGALKKAQDLEGFAVCNLTLEPTDEVFVRRIRHERYRTTNDDALRCYGCKCAGSPPVSRDGRS